MAHGCDGRCGGEVHALAGQRANGGQLSKQNAGHRRCGRREQLGAGYRLAGGVCAHPAQRLEPDRPHDHQLVRHWLEHHFGLADQLGELSLDTCRRDQLLEVLQPTAALPTERDRVGLASAQTINESVGAVRGLRGIALAASRQSVVFVDRHVLLLLSFVVCV